MHVYVTTLHNVDSLHHLDWNERFVMVVLCEIDEEMCFDHLMDKFSTIDIDAYDSINDEVFMQPLLLFAIPKHSQNVCLFINTNYVLAWAVSLPAHIIR